ncbi:MAG TPA: hypothetical protein VK797_22565 [Tepidisphaeraceae bacterium]|nr:hypothetical protein [Tepidisphaeraceae bacterium]
MPWIVDYSQVSQQMLGQGMRCVYYNSGAFAFADGAQTESVGWIGPHDPSLRPEARELTIEVPPPFEQQLARRVVRAIGDLLPGKVWVMPKSHWAYELDYGSRDWMPALLEHVGVDAGLLQPRTNAAAIEFALQETQPLSHLLEGLLRMLLGSDFALGFPDRAVVCTIHHHKQVWWTSTDRRLIESLRQLGRAPAV